MHVTLHKGKLLEKIRDCIVLLNGGELEELIREALTEGIPPLEILNAMSAGMDEVGKKYESQEYFLSELIFSGEIFKKGIGTLLTERKKLPKLIQPII